MSLMAMIMIMCRSAYLTIDDNEYEEDEKDDDDDAVEYSDEGEERVYSGKNRHTTDPNSDSEENSYQQGSYVSDDEDVFTSVGDSEEDVTQYSHHRERIKSSYVPDRYY
jgi:hypothetical protein